MNKLLLDALSDRDAHGHGLKSIQYVRICMSLICVESSLHSYLQVTAVMLFHRHSMQIGASKMTVALCSAPSELITASRTSTIDSRELSLLYYLC